MHSNGFAENRPCRDNGSLAPVHRGIGTALAALVLMVGLCVVLPAEGQACQNAGQACIDGGGCCDGSSCGPPGWEICYDVPRLLEQPCSVSGDDRCAEGLSCHPGIPQRCYNEPRQAGQPCDVNHECGDRGFVCHPLLLRCVPDEALEPFDDASCAVFYDQSQADAALDLGNTLWHGIGLAGGTVPEGSTQVGVVYGANGEFGCFEAHCVGSGPDASGSPFYTFGVIKDWPSFAGTSLVKPGEVSAPFLEIGFETGQVWAPGFAELLGAVSSVSVGDGFLPAGDDFLTCDTVVNEIECATELRADSDGDGVLDCYDGCPDDATMAEEGRCQCGAPCREPGHR